MEDFLSFLVTPAISEEVCSLETGDLSLLLKQLVFGVILFSFQVENVATVTGIAACNATDDVSGFIAVDVILPSCRRMDVNVAVDVAAESDG